MGINELLIGAVFLVLITFGIFIIFLIFYIGSLNKAIKSTLIELQNFSKSIETILREVSNDLNEIKSKFEASLSNLDETTVQIKKSFQNFDAKVNSFDSLYKPFSELSQYVYQRIAPPLLTASRVVSGISKAVEVFVNILSTKKTDKR